MPEYTHTLIPVRLDFFPEPQQVADFFDAMSSLKAAPLTPRIEVAKLAGNAREFKNPFTGEIVSYPIRKATKIKDAAKLRKALNGLDDYDVSVSGNGPPKLPAFAFDFEGKYYFSVNCCLRASVVSTSDWHDDSPPNKPSKRKVQPFGQPCSTKDRLGIYTNPNTLEIIKVPKAGCARFWIEFEFGKMLFPDIEDRLDLIESSILEAAESNFGIDFVQGCNWCA